MNRFFTINPVVFVLFVNRLTNGLAWAFHGEVFMHELGHDHQHTLSTAHPYNEFSDEKNLNLSVHICFELVYQPFVFTKLPFRPPRSIFLIPRGLATGLFIILLFTFFLKLQGQTVDNWKYQ